MGKSRGRSKGHREQQQPKGTAHSPLGPEPTISSKELAVDLDSHAPINPESPNLVSSRSPSRAALKHDSKHWLDYATAGFAFFAAIATGAAAIFTGWQAWTAKDTEERQLRAYLIVTELGVFCPDCGDGALKSDLMPQIKNSIRHRIENNGQTPASQVTGTTSWVYQTGKETRLPDNFSFPDNEREGFVSRSDLGRDKHKDSAGEILPKEFPLFKGVASGDGTLFIYGHVDYCDIFRIPRSTAFCFVYLPNGGLSMPLCDRYNGEIPAKGKC